MHALIEAHREQLLLLARRRGVTNVRLFGSMVRGGERGDSDVDSTMNGPIASRDHSQPANLLWNNQYAILVDAGDGAAEQTATAGYSLSDVDTIILSHLHVDHTGGLSALIGMRYRQRIPGIPQARVTIARHYSGPVAFVKDLDNYQSGAASGHWVRQRTDGLSRSSHDSLDGAFGRRQRGTGRRDRCSRHG